MGKCVTCGNEYDRSFDITMSGKTQTFDSFEWAITLLAPRCNHCSAVIIGHGVQSGDKIFCCANCAHTAGESGLEDRK